MSNLLMSDHKARRIGYGSDMFVKRMFEIRRPLKVR